MSSPDLHTEQPMPVPNESTSVQALVRHDLDAREQVGKARYGTSLQAHNGRDALRDAYEEALDLSCYLRQAIEERPREDVDAAVTAVRAELQTTIERQAALIAELGRQYTVAERVRDKYVTAARRVPRMETALRWAQEALVAAPQTCRFHGTDFGDTKFGEPRCESCRLPYKVRMALLNINAELGGTS